MCKLVLCSYCRDNTLICMCWNLWRHVCVFPPPLSFALGACVSIMLLRDRQFQWLWKQKQEAPPSEDLLYGYAGTNVIGCPCAASLDAKFMCSLHRLKLSKAPAATLSMQLAKNNNAMWHVISNGDQPPLHLIWCCDPNKCQESPFKTRKTEVLPETPCKYQKMSDLERPWPAELLIKSVYKKGKDMPAISLANYMFMLRGKAVLIELSLIVCSPVKSTLANPKEPSPYFPRQNTAVAMHPPLY